MGEGWYAKPAAAYMLEKGIATWSDFVWSLDATAHVDQESVTQALQQMEAAWPEERELLSNRSCRPVHDFVMASEYVAVSRIRDALATVPSRYLKAVKTDCVVFQDLPKKFQGLVDGLVRQKHPDGTPVYRCEEVKGLEGQYRILRIEAECPCCSTVNWKAAEDPVLHCLEGGGLLLTATRAPGKPTWRARS